MKYGSEQILPYNGEEQKSDVCSTRLQARMIC